MWIYFDASMIATTRVYDTPIRQGDIGDELFVRFAGYNSFTNKFVTLQIEYPDGLLSPEVYMELGYSKQFTLPTQGDFTNGVTYYGVRYIFADPSWFQQFGLHKITVRIYTGVGGQPTAIETTGLFNFNVEKSVFNPEAPITVAQYQYLLSVVNATQIDITNTIVVVDALPNLNELNPLGGYLYNERWFVVRAVSPLQLGTLFYINQNQAVQVELGLNTLQLQGVSGNEGQIKWNADKGSIEMILQNGVTTFLNKALMFYCKATEAIDVGDVCEFVNYQGDHILIRKARPSSINANPSLVMGLAANTMANNGFGYVTAFGEIFNIPTRGLTQGSFIWFDSANVNFGQWTSTTPTAPNAKVLCGVVTVASSNPSSTNGRVLVRLTYEPKLADLQDVYITNPLHLQIIRYNATLTRWENSSDIPANNVDLQNHINNLSNPHQVTKSQVGLSNVTNDAQIPLSQKGVAQGVATLGLDGRLPLSQSPLILNDVTNLINSTIYADTLSLPTPTSAEYAAGDFDRPKALVLTNFGSPSQWMPKLYEVEFSGPPTNAYLWVDTGEFVSLGKYYTDITNNTTYRYTGYVANDVTFSNFFVVLNSSLLSGKADLVSGVVPVSQLPLSVDEVIIIQTNFLYLNLTQASGLITTQNSYERRFLICGSNGTNINTVDVYRLPPNANPSVVGNYVFERTIGLFGVYRQELILVSEIGKLFYITGNPWITANAIELTPFFEEVRNGSTNLPFDSWVYRIACDQNAFNPNDQARTFYALGRKFSISGTIYRGSVFQFTNNFNQFEDFTITRNGDFYAVLNQNNTTTVVVGTVIYNVGGNWETSQSGNHRITLIIADPRVGSPTLPVVIIEKI